MVGIPDGLGGTSAARTSFTLHDESRAHRHRRHRARPRLEGRVRVAWVIDRRTLEVVKGEDFTPSAAEGASCGTRRRAATCRAPRCGSATARPICRWRAPSIISGKGTRDRIYMNGEEVTEGRAGRGSLPGRTPARPGSSRASAVSRTRTRWRVPHAAAQDGGDARRRQRAEHRAGGRLLPRRGLHLRRHEDEARAPGRAGGPDERPSLRRQGQRWTVSRSPRRAMSSASATPRRVRRHGTLQPARPRRRVQSRRARARAGLDHQPASRGSSARRTAPGIPARGRRDDYYFVTTASLTLNCRLWHLNFDDIERPERGGTITILLKGDEGHGMLDNVTIDRWGRILMDEDPGNSTRISKVWLYQIDDRRVRPGRRAQSPRSSTRPAQQPDLHHPGRRVVRDHRRQPPPRATAGSCSTVQAHKQNSDPELVEGGQLLALFVDPRIGETGGASTTTSTRTRVASGRGCGGAASGRTRGVPRSRPRPADRTAGAGCWPRGAGGRRGRGSTCRPTTRPA